MYFIDPADAEFKDDFLQKKKRWESGKDPWHQPCRAREWFTLAPRRWKESRKLKSGISWIHKTTTGSSPPTKHEDYIAGKGFRWPITMCRKFIPMPQAMKIPDAKAAVDKEWKKLETIPAWNMEKVKKQEGGHCRSTKRQNRKSSLLNCDGHMPPKKRWRKNPNYRSILAESYSVVTLWKTTLEPTQFLLNRARLRLQWLPQK